MNNERKELERLYISLCLANPCLSEPVDYFGEKKRRKHYVKQARHLPCKDIAAIVEELKLMYCN